MGDVVVAATVPVRPGCVSAIVPTIGRPESLAALLSSLCEQSFLPHEVIIADGSSGREVQGVVERQVWADRGLRVRRITVTPPNAVRQRVAAISEANGEYLLLLDDDVVLEPACLREMLHAFDAMPDVVAVGADFNNQTWSNPTKIWRFYLRYVCGLKEGEWQGRVLGPLLRFGYNPVPSKPLELEWLGSGMSLVKRIAYERAGGFSDFFLHRCTINEDVDLGLKLSRIGKIIFCPTARMGHFHAAQGRVSVATAAEDDLYNRYLVMRHTQERSAVAAFSMVLVYFGLETVSNVIGGISRLQWRGFGARFMGRVRAIWRIIVQWLSKAERA